MKRNVWILNHYATNTFKDQAGRHYWFADNLIGEDYNPTIFCASTIHNSNEIIDTNGANYSTDSLNNIPYVFIKTPEYKGNGKKRIFNMIMFYRGLFKTAKQYAELNGKPDVILASSVHPLTLIAGIKIAKKFGISCICEVRDLWPETLIAYGKLDKNNLITKALYAGEKWIYKSADKLIFTMEGGKDYIIDHGWDKDQGGPIDIRKVYHINNGVDLKVFNYNKEHFQLEDDDLDNPNNFKVIYAGSIRQVNNVRSIVEAASGIQKIGIKDVKFIIFGDGSDRQSLEAYCTDNRIDNVVFKGFVEKKKIPYILSKSDLNIMHFDQNNLKKYGASLNKLFEYFASGKPILSDCQFGYDLVERYDCGVIVDNASPEELAEEIIKIRELSIDDYNSMCDNALKAAKDYDFKELTGKLINIIEGDN
ncbi:glycosyltransferase family 4 protein [Fusibacter tunisiensis]|uniref:Glycosyltransferase involved in cell wall biosynthesis n=1 Tax=Fusibacter tunisiensis TaxID=1008308 RepID=A0ABS2MNB3_9FIRM|nr:glycosyltransferase family 4 protein [Fusibacter tunisiensis]MBM7560896.1 glycosyltransferase involved in cell wall biosynthesis [Fusibacter tunisiensis]